ncbi:MAG: hypothetical protein VKL59_16330 [Nostocaceae cyanobacterium]|nr:hypothetical protein [Nostocaceae cyanobacterium]
MDKKPPGQMTWRPPGVSGCALHLRKHSLEPWRPYYEFPEYAQSDPPGFSPGYTTFLALRKQNWQAV